MKRSFSIVLFAVVLTMGTSALAGVRCGASGKCYTDGPQRNLDTGEMAPEPVDNMLKHYSYVIPYLPKGTKQVYKAPGAGPCTEDGVVDRNTRSSRGCYIFSSPNGIFMIQIHKQSSSFSYVPRIWKKVNEAWMPWVEFDTGGQATYASAEAVQFAERSAPRKYEEQPQYAKESPAVPEVLNNPNLGTVIKDLGGIIRKSR